MEVIHSLAIRCGERVSRSSTFGYSPLNRSLSVDRDATADRSPRPNEQNPVNSWRTEPKFEVSVDFHKIGRHIVPILLTLLPSFALPSKKPKKLFPTSYLDGLRGVAAFFVVVYHYTTSYTERSQTGYGLQRGEKGSHNWFWLLPIVRVVHAGRFMVTLFFVISGYVLSYRSLKLARQGKHLELLDSLASSVFRRWLRLHLPVVASTFLAFSLARWNLWTHVPEGWEHDPHGTYIALHPIPFPSRDGSFFHQLGDWYRDAQQLCDPFLYGEKTISKYNIGVLWTIPLEWTGSMLVFAVVLGISRTKTWVKLSLLCLLIYRCHQTARWVPACFLAGILLAEMSFIYSRPIEPPSAALDLAENEKLVDNTRRRRYLSFAYKAFFIFLFILGIHVGSHPRDGWHETPGYRWLFKHVPAAYDQQKTERASFWPSISAFVVIFSLEMAPFLQSIFTTSIAQYLGNISFALYMIHCQIEYTLGHWLIPKCMDITGGWGNGQLGFFAGMALAIMVLGPVTFWVADVFSRLVDEKCVKLARWTSTKAFVKT